MFGKPRFNFLFAGSTSEHCSRRMPKAVPSETRDEAFAEATRKLNNPTLSARFKAVLLDGFFVLFFGISCINTPCAYWDRELRIKKLY